MDADLVTALGSTPTVMEKLYAEAIEDTRLQSTALAAERAKASQDLETFRAAMVQWMAWMKEQYNTLPPELFTDEDRLFHTCCLKAFEVRKQTTSTSTTKATFNDMVKDSVYMGYVLYNYLAREKGLPQKTIPADVTPAT